VTDPLFLLLPLLACGGDATTSGATDSDTDTATAQTTGTADSATPDSATPTDTDTQPPEPDYACGWPRNDPGDLVTGGNEIGHVIGNLQGTDQCGEVVDLWDMHGAYNLVFIAGAW